MPLQQILAHLLWLAESGLGCDTGNPQVYFVKPVPVPVNTVPTRVGVRCYPWVWAGFRGYLQVCT